MRKNRHKNSKATGSVRDFAKREAIKARTEVLKTVALDVWRIVYWLVKQLIIDDGA